MCTTHVLPLCRLVMTTQYLAGNIQCGAVITQSVFWKITTPVRASYWVSFVYSNTDLYSFPVSEVMYVISWYFEPRYNDTRLQWLQWHHSNIMVCRITDNSTICSALQAAIKEIIHPVKSASNSQSVSMSWRHHETWQGVAGHHLMRYIWVIFGRIKLQRHTLCTISRGK